MFLPRLSPFGDAGGKRVLRLELLQKGGLGGFLFRREALILCSRRNIPTWSFGREKSVCVWTKIAISAFAAELAARQARSRELEGSKLVKIWSLHLGVQGVSYRCYFQDVSHFR